MSSLVLESFRFSVLHLDLSPACWLSSRKPQPLHLLAQIPTCVQSLLLYVLPLPTLTLPDHPALWTRHRFPTAPDGLSLANVLSVCKASSSYKMHHVSNQEMNAKSQIRVYYFLNLFSILFMKCLQGYNFSILKRREWGIPATAGLPSRSRVPHEY